MECFLLASDYRHMNRTMDLIRFLKWIKKDSKCNVRSSILLVHITRIHVKCIELLYMFLTILLTPDNQKAIWEITIDCSFVSVILSK
jgi:hypothetical protein